MSLLLGCADARRIPLPDASVQCCITSPPYWGLRDYGTGQWEGGEPDCDHSPGNESRVGATTLEGGKATSGHKQEPYRDWCRKCGARRVDRQIGLEASPDEYVAQMVAVFREVWRVLRDDSCVFLNLGDSYFGDSPTRKRSSEAFSETWDKSQTRSRGGNRRSAARVDGLKPKDLCMIPARVALALQADGWYLRSDIIWAKGVSFCPTYSGSVMPESVRDRPTQSYEHVFLLAKSKSYYYDAEAVKEPSVYPNDNRKGRALETHRRMPTDKMAGIRPGSAEYPTRNLRSVWAINPKPSKLKHYAAFPPALVEPMVLAGTSAKGCCPECGKPWERVVERGEFKTLRGGEPFCPEYGQKMHGLSDLSGAGMTSADGFGSYERTTTGWRPGCTCGTDLEPVPCKVLDCFGGTMTVGEVCAKHGRHFVGLDLKREYVEMGRERCASVQTAMTL